MGNLTPESGIRIPAQALQDLVTALFAKVGMNGDDARLMAELLVATDLRGVFSHGTHQTGGYVKMIREGRVNARPNIAVASTTSTTRIYDGDGGMGHLPSWQAANFVADTAAELGVAAATTGNHFHFGGAGKYSRVAAARECIGLAVSSHRWERRGMISNGATGGSPISIAIPAGEGVPPLVIDMSTRFLPWKVELFEQMPFAYFKDLGLGSVAHALGGVLAGIWQPARMPPASQWESNQGGFFAAFQVAALCPIEDFRTEMSRYVDECRQLEPFPGHTRAELPGGIEWRNEADFGRDGIPISAKHEESLRDLAADLGIDTPFDSYESTRFGASS
ncbi:MAG: Ldh family oxidoreductase [Candidatus Latescibacteria bacterium]|nr:Ldh family oxidoreductase [Candidatus Latescibacterota bacterium]MDP7447656.1 Ldh family oxidoreductase [Candidatus Latescibacterota bacterium]HJP33318.1 Ldh family oxidoreductase [Candidatus Latescibacterota bacterium]